jgi:hypothetical protein
LEGRDEANSGATPDGKPIIGLLPAYAEVTHNDLNAIGIASMALTNAQKQARYCERHLGIDGTKARGQFFLSADTRVQLGRLVARFNQIEG